MDETIELQKETVEISGDRKLYNYKFKIDGETVEVTPPPAKNADLAT